MWRAGGGRVNRARFFRNLAGKPHRDEPRFALPFANGTRHGGPPTARATTRVAMRPCRLPQRLGKPAARLPTPAHPGTTHQPRTPTGRAFMDLPRHPRTNLAPQHPADAGGHSDGTFIARRHDGTFIARRHGGKSIARHHAPTSLPNTRPTQEAIQTGNSLPGDTAGNPSPGTTHQPRSPTAGRRRRPFRRDIHCPASRREIHRPSTNARIQTDDALLADDRPEHSSPRPRSRCRCPRARRITPSPRPLPSRRETQRPSPAGRLVPCPPTLLAPT